MNFVKNLSLVVASSGLILLGTTEAQAVSLSYDSSIGRPANLAEGEFPGCVAKTLLEQSFPIN